MSSARYACSLNYSIFFLLRSKIRSSRQRNDSIATIKLEDLFGTVTSRPSPVEYMYPNTVPQARQSTLKSLGLSDEDMVKPGYSSASMAATKRRSQQFSISNKYDFFHSFFSLSEILDSFKITEIIQKKLKLKRPVNSF